MVRAVIDIGSNSIKMRIAATDSRGRIRLLRDETEVVRLGRGMSLTGMLSRESMESSCEAVSRMVKRALAFGAEVFIAGTMALRTAGNAHEFVSMVKEATGQDVHVFSGEEEARYSWIGAVDGLSLEGDAVMFDTGGGSTEFVQGHGADIHKVVSVPVGAVNVSERFFSDDGPVKMGVCDEAVKFVADMLRQYGIGEFRTGSFSVIGVGGGVAAMSSVKQRCDNFMPHKLHGSILTLRDINTQIKMYASLTLKERESVIGLPASRADVILGSACIVLAALRVLEVKSCVVSINGLRHGLLMRDVRTPGN